MPSRIQASKSATLRSRKPAARTAPTPTAVFGPFDPRDDHLVAPDDPRILEADIRSDLAQIEAAAAILPDARVDAALALAFGPARDSACVTAFLARRSGVDLLCSLPGTEMVPFARTSDGDPPLARLRFRPDREFETRAAIERAWSSLVLMAWEVDAEAAARAGLPSAEDPTTPDAHEGHGESGTFLVRKSPANGDLVYACKSEATELDRIYAAIRDSKTWGEFRAAMPRDEYSEIIRRRFDDEGEPRPRSRDRFEPEAVPGYFDGDYPRWIQACMDSSLPEDVIRNFGRSSSTRLNGEYLELAPCDRLAINRRLRRHGYRVLDGSHLTFM